MRAVGVGVLFAAATAAAGPLERGFVVVEPSPGADVVPNVIYLNRCTGGCTIHFGLDDDARTQTSQIPMGGTVFQMTEYAWGDAEWAQLVHCATEVFSPFAVTVTDVQPDPSVDYNEAIVAGLPTELGLSSGFGGIAPIAAQCQVVDHAISFSFANAYSPADRVHEVCWTVAQEVAHTYGLDHEYEFEPGDVSACNDPMTYRTDCGGEKFFRDRSAKCGEFTARNCRCSNVQTSHKQLAHVLGAATPITTVTAAISTPANGAAIADGVVIHVPASAQRGIATVELWLNGYKWTAVDGAPFGPNGQPDGDYAIPLPDGVPDGVIDIQAIAKDDLGVMATAQVTVTKGAPCETAETCATGQRCDAGKCLWDPPTGETGDGCSYPQFCASGMCPTVDGESFCTEPCVPGQGTCPSGTDCLASGNTTGFCWPQQSGGCCSTGGSGWPPFALSAVVLGLALRRRR